MKGIITTVITIVFVALVAVIIKPEMVDTIHDFYEEAVEADHIKVYNDDEMIAIAFIDDSGRLNSVFGWDFEPAIDTINDILYSLRD